MDQLNSLIAELSISSAHRERVFLEERLKVAKQDLDDASNQLAQFSSQNSSVDVQTMGRAALDAAGRVAGELIAAAIPARRPAPGLQRQKSTGPFARRPGGGTQKATGKAGRIERHVGLPLDRARSSGRMAAQADGLYNDMRGNDTTAKRDALSQPAQLALVGSEICGLLPARENSGNGLSNS